MNGTSPSNPSPQGSGNSAEKEVKDCKNQRGYGAARKLGLLPTHELTETVAT